MQHVFQRIVDLRNGQTIGLEALARFPKRTPLEELKVLYARGEQALRDFDLRSMRMAIENTQNWLPKGCRLFVNLTHATVAAALAGQQLPEGPIWELAETSATALVMAQPDAWNHLTKRVVLALDDVGEGSADFSRLSAAVRYGAGWIKAARSLVHGCADNPGQRAVLRAIAALGVPVIAEGTERANDLAALGEAGIYLAQGYALGRPLPVEAVRQKEWIFPVRLEK